MTPSMVEITTCQLCGSNDSSTQFDEAPFTVLRCGGCGLVYVTPRYEPEALRKIYTETYWKSDKPREQGYADYAADAELYLKTFRKRIALLPKPASGKLRILDVGCAAGFFLRVAAEHGHEVIGVEPSAAIAANAKQHLGEDSVHVGTLDDLPDDARFAPGSFDVVTMWDVVEHVPDPQDLLRKARRLLKPDGTLVIETQNVSSQFARLLGKKWHHYKHAEHLYHFNPQTVRDLLQQAGFEITKNTASYGGKYVSLSFIVERAARLHPAVSFLLKPLVLLKGANLYLNFRDEMVILARPSASAAPSEAARSPSVPAAH